MRATLALMLAAAAPAEPARWDATAEKDRHGCPAAFLPFDSGSAKLTPGGLKFLDNMAEWTRKMVDAGAWLEVHANADHLEVREKPEIGRLRGEAARAYLAGRGFDPRHVRIVDWRDAHPMIEPGRPRCPKSNYARIALLGFRS